MKNINNSYLFILTLLLSSTSLNAARYNTEEVHPSVLKEVNVSLIQKTTTSNKDYSYLLDNRDPRFWNEGEHIPDEAFIILGQDPTNLEKAKIWLLRNEKKAKVLAIMLSTIEQAKRDLIKSGQMEDRYDELESLPNKLARKEKEIVKMKMEDVTLFFVFHPECKYCHKQSQVLAGMKNVVPLQVGGTQILNFPHLPESEMMKEEVKRSWFSEENISTPQILVMNNQTNKVTRLIGLQSLESIIDATSKVVK